MNSINHIAHPSIDTLTNLAEENAIRKLEAYYVIMVDARNFSLLRNVFARDVVADYGPGIGVVNGVENLISTLEPMTAPVKAQHTLSTQVITVAPPTYGEQPTATAVTYFVANQFGKAGGKEEVPLYAYGRYEDALVKIADEWKISHRVLTYMGPHQGDISIFGV